MLTTIIVLSIILGIAMIFVFGSCLVIKELKEENNDLFGDLDLKSDEIIALEAKIIDLENQLKEKNKPAQRKTTTRKTTTKKKEVKE